VASDITLTTALLTGQIDPRGLESSYVVEVGTDTTYGTSIAGEVGAASENVTISIPVIELAPGSTYHYRFVAVNPDGRVYGPDQTFSTPAYEHPIVLPTVEPLLSVPASASSSLAEEAATPKQKHRVARRRSRSKHHGKATHRKRAGKRTLGRSRKK
jgi:hypothetical protein